MDGSGKHSIMPNSTEAPATRKGVRSVVRYSGFDADHAKPSGPHMPSQAMATTHQSRTGRTRLGRRLPPARIHKGPLSWSANRGPTPAPRRPANLLVCQLAGLPTCQPANLPTCWPANLPARELAGPPARELAGPAAGCGVELQWAGEPGQGLLRSPYLMAFVAFAGRQRSSRSGRVEA